MSKNLRLVVLDYPKLTIQSAETKKILADMIQAKQINFERSDANYVPLGGLDMVSTHFLIYDTTDIYNPKVVFAIRNCYEDRVRRHNLTLPSEEYIKHVPENIREEYFQFRKKHSVAVDCNAWFVDPDYTYSKTGLTLSDIGYMMVITHIFRRGFNHLLGATNETFKASRWLENVAVLPPGLLFEHHVVKSPHRLILASPFKLDWLLNCFDKYGEYYYNRLEVAPIKELSKEETLNDEQLMILLKENQNAALVA
jgi:hypothetical protein